VKKQILFIHSGGIQNPSTGSSSLVDYLRTNLDHEYEVLFPQMPDPENPSYVEWKEKLAHELETLNREVILVGHSLGGSVLLKFLSENKWDKTIAGLFVIAAPYWGKTNWKVREYVLQDNFSNTLTGIEHIFLYHCTYDEVVPVDHLAVYSNKLPQAEVREFETGGHLFSQGIPELISDITSLNNY
jgi:predicted alpha/beta hydrolase family esterase